jgi:hypothetical protein
MKLNNGASPKMAGTAKHNGGMAAAAAKAQHQAWRGPHRAVMKMANKHRRQTENCVSGAAAQITASNERWRRGSNGDACCGWHLRRAQRS